MKRLKGLYILQSDALEQVYGPEERREIAEIVDIVGPPMTREEAQHHKDLLHGIDVLFSGWSPPQLNTEFLDAAPNLKTVFYGAGAIGSIMTDEAWARGITITTANAGNAIPVAEYCLGATLFALKNVFRLARVTRESKTFPAQRPVAGAYGSTVGLVSMGEVGRTFRKLLNAFDLRVIAYDPFITASDARNMNIELVSLPDVFRRSDVVSIHTPLLEETQGLITGAHVAAMKQGATLINTSRGRVVREEEIMRILRDRPDLTAILDVTDPEPPAVDSPLYDMPNVLVTPHIAGSLDGECRRMGHMMIEELKRYVEGKPLLWCVTPQMVDHSCHRPINRKRALAVA